AREITGEGTLPNPVIATVSDERVGSLLKIERFEATDPTPLGANRTVTSTDCPPGIVVGSAGDTMLYRRLEALIEVTLRSAVPLLLTVIVRSLVWPEFTLPTASEAELVVMDGTGL